MVIINAFVEAIYNLLGIFIYRDQVRNTYFWNSFAMNEYQNNMDISCESDLNNNTTRERDSQANYTSVESSEGCSIVASSDLSKSSTILPVICQISDV